MIQKENFGEMDGKSKYLINLEEEIKNDLFTLILIFDKVYCLIGCGEDDVDVHYNLHDGREFLGYTTLCGYIPLKKYIPKKEYDELVRVWNLNLFNYFNYQAI